MQALVRPAAARYSECAKCHDPMAQPGICRLCVGLDTRTLGVGRSEAAARVGAARVRDAMRAAKAALQLGPDVVVAR
ncbi:hypothetical protein [Kitasatospora sp. NPDC059599]|uniref:hypothetical protein n=1 Tax=Kitasatospora sp. NPDC059599 TaxID=3346880 RepID=UPI0036816F36